MQTSTTAFRLSLRAFANLAFLALALCLLATTAAQAQISHSIDFQGPTVGQPAANMPMVPIGPGDVLRPGAGTPGIRIPAGVIGINPSTATGLPEVDAMSFGWDPLVNCNLNRPLLFSVDEFAVGAAGVGMAPNVNTEGAGPGANQEASADVYGSTARPSVCPNAAIVGHTGFIDGNGVAPFAAPGLVLIEPNPPTVGGAAENGGNVDALICGNSTGELYFSLDAAPQDPLEGPPVHSGTAQANGPTGVSPAAVLVATAGGITVFATPPQMGLTLADDIDALLLRENGNLVYDPSTAPFDWNNGQTDMLLFSVTRRSPLAGTVDSLQGLQIAPGDVLTVTANGPGILYTAEALGLLRTNGYAGFGDNLNALAMPPCN